MRFHAASRIIRSVGVVPERKKDVPIRVLGC